VPFPGWEPFEGPDAADLDDQTRQRVAATTVAVPGQVATGVVRLGDDRRFDVPVVLICPEFTPAEARSWIGEDQRSELARVKRLDLVDIDSGHWPMFTKPAELARLLADAADSV
jgi:pimeloyl-ACP methyl ester carboxylesterase